MQNSFNGVPLDNSCFFVIKTDQSEGYENTRLC